MLKQILIPGTSLRASEYALGTGAWGSEISLDQSLLLYDAYRAAGGNVFDTAHVYAAWVEGGLGISERTLGDIIKRRDDRRHLLIMTKGAHPAFLPHYPRPDRYLTRATIRSDLTDSLDRLALPQVDLFLLHRDDRRVPVGEIIDMLNEEVSDGRIRYFGVSNWRTARIEEANNYADKKGVMGFVASQPQFSLGQPNEKESDDDTAGRFLSPEDLAWHWKTQFPAFCYSPTALGYFATAGKKGLGYENPVSRGRLERAQVFAARRGVTPNQIAIAWVRSQGNWCMPLLGTTKLDHLQDALASAAINLTPDEVRWLSAG